MAIRWSFALLLLIGALCHSPSAQAAAAAWPPSECVSPTMLPPDLDLSLNDLAKACCPDASANEDLAFQKATEICNLNKDNTALIRNASNCDDVMAGKYRLPEDCTNTREEKRQEDKRETLIGALSIALPIVFGGGGLVGMAVWVRRRLKRKRQLQEGGGLSATWVSSPRLGGGAGGNGGKLPMYGSGVLV